MICHHNCAPSRGAPAPATTYRVQLPNDHLGMLLDNGTASAYAIHLVAFKRLHGDSWSINEQRVANPVAEGGIEMGERKLRKGLALAKRSGILDRRKGGRRPDGKRAFAREKLAPPGGDGYVELPEALVRSIDSKLVGFVAAVKLARLPRDARDMAQRIGVSIKSPNTIKRLVEAAVAGQHIAAVRVGSRWIVGRYGVNLAGFKNVAIEDVAIKNVAIHSNQKDGHSELKDASQESASQLYGVVREQPAAAAAGQPPAADHQKDDLIVLNDWRSARCFRAGGRRLDLDCLDDDGPRPQIELVTMPHQHTPPVDCAKWGQMLARYGYVPQHLTTPASYLQSMDLIGELAAVSKRESFQIVYGLAWAIAEAVRRSRPIRSLGFIAERLLRRATNGDELWMFDVPSVEDPKVIGMAMGHAHRYIVLAKGRGIATDDRALLGTVELENLIRMLGPSMSLAPDFERRIAMASTPAEGRQVCAWSYFPRCQPPREVASQPPDDVASIAEDLRAIDPGKVLRFYLLTEKGIQPYLRLLEEHGSRARDLLALGLKRAAADGWQRGCVTSWTPHIDQLRTRLRAA